MLTDMKLKALKPAGKIYKVADQQGLYVAVTRTGVVSFRFDYRVNGRRETLVIGQYDPNLGAKKPRDLVELDYGMSLTLAEARLLLTRAYRSVEHGESPSRTKVEKRFEAADALTFGKWAGKYFAEADLAESTRSMRKSVYARGLKIDNPAEAIRPSSIATFKARDRALSPAEIHTFFNALDQTATTSTLRLAVKFMLLTLVRKSEFIEATWGEANFETAIWTIPKERMKAGRPHNVYLSQQALDILVAFKTCFSARSYLHPGRYETELPISAATLNRVIDATVKLIRGRGEDFEPFTVHDLRRTASTLLHEAGFNSDWIEKCLAHEQRGVRAIYNKAEYAEQRRAMLQTWVDMLDGWIKNGVNVVPIRRGVSIA